MTVASIPILSGQGALPSWPLVRPPPEVAAAYHDADLDTQVIGLLDAAADGIHGCLVKAGAFFAPQGLTADFQENTVVFQFHKTITPHSYSINAHRAYFTIKPAQSKQEKHLPSGGMG